MPAPGSGGDRISTLLVEIRGRRTQTDAAARSGLAQGTISKAERGQLTLRPDVARAYAGALGASRAQRDELVVLCQAVADTTVTRQTRLVRKGAAAQRQFKIIERQSHEIRTWQAEIIPGLLQTWAYTLAVIEREPDRAWTEQRRARLALLDDSDRRVLQLVPEGVLRTNIIEPPAMREQLAHLVELSRRPNVRIGVLPHGPVLPPFPPSFDIYADRMAITETLAGVAFLDDHRDVARHRAWFDRLEAAAIHDDEARDLISSIRP